MSVSVIRGGGAEIPARVSLGHIVVFDSYDDLALVVTLPEVPHGFSDFTQLAKTSYLNRRPGVE